MQIKWLPTALENLDNAAKYFEEHNPKAAKAFVQEVYDLTHLLKQHPSMGRAGRVFGTRELILQNFPFLIPYRVKDNCIEILRIFPTKMAQPEYW